MKKRNIVITSLVSAAVIAGASVGLVSNKPHNVSVFVDPVPVSQTVTPDVAPAVVDPLAPTTDTQAAQSTLEPGTSTNTTQAPNTAETAPTQATEPIVSVPTGQVEIAPGITGLPCGTPEAVGHVCTSL